MISEKMVKLYCSGDITKIENYNEAINDKNNIWVCHHKREINDNGILTKPQLKEMNLYYHRPPEELMFLTNEDHTKMHTHYYNYKKSEEHKSNLSKTRIDKGLAKGKNNPMYGTKTKYLYKDDIVKRVDVKDVEKYINNGWKFGNIHKMK